MAEHPAPAAIPRLPPEASARLLALFSAEPAVQEVWLYGSRAMGRHRPGSDIDLTLVAPASSLALADDVLCFERQDWQSRRSGSELTPAAHGRPDVRRGLSNWSTGTVAPPPPPPAGMAHSS